VKSHWIMVSPAVSQVALHFGVNDLEGTVVREKIYHAVGAKTSQAMSLDEILRLVRGAGKVPAERDSFYRVLRTFDDPERRPPAPRSPGRPDVSAQSGPAAPGRTRDGRRLRVGRIPYINCYPVYGAVDRGLVPLDAELVDGIPTALNARMRRGLLDVSVVSRSSTPATATATCSCPTSPSRATGRSGASCCSATRRPRR
jgi:hypothetical protein